MFLAYSSTSSVSVGLKLGNGGEEEEEIIVGLGRFLNFSSLEINGISKISSHKMHMLRNCRAYR